MAGSLDKKREEDAIYSKFQLLASTRSYEPDTGDTFLQRFTDTFLFDRA
jgi:hypothetical protein